MTTPASVVNEALGQIAGQTSISGSLPNFDGSPAGLAAGVYYAPIVNLVLRQQDWECARTVLPLALAVGVSAPPPWAYAYTFPLDCMRVRQIWPATWSANDPQPVRWSVMFTSGPSPQRVILTNLFAPYLTYTTNLLTENQWDSVLQESVVRMLSNVLALDLSGRADLAREKIAEASQLVQSGGGLDS